MATSAPNTGARSRAPRNPAGIVPPQDVKLQLNSGLCNAQSDASMIDALAIGMQVMLMQLKDSFIEANVRPYLLESDLWIAMQSLMELTRQTASEIAENCEDLEILLASDRAS